MKIRKLVVLIVLLTFTAVLVNAQYNIHWRKIRHEVSFGMGTTSFLGELGGSNTVGSHFVKDFDFNSSRWIFQGGYSYKLAEQWAVKANVLFGRLYGSDAKTEELHRGSRNLSFRAPFVDFAATIDFSIIKERYGHRYDLRRIKGKNNLPNLYIYTGIGGTWFNPKAQYTDGKWYALQPLGTEGQGIIPTREKYSRLCLTIPVGLGLNYMIDRNFGIGFEYGVRFTLSDYLDDVSTTYVDPSIFSDPMAAYFSSGTADPDWPGVGAGQQRGQNDYNDAFMVLTLKVTYKLRPRAPGMPKF
ncbi:MAG: DUF6089 family protein [Bacteroidales bacterium]|nr:DUF6089 family protein [Bacteroidales bacterium]MDY0141825.1 DUF6089 family protein [Bacteroidales bacterium]